MAGTSGRSTTDKAGRAEPMSESKCAQPAAQAGSTGEAAGVGPAVGGVRSSDDFAPGFWFGQPAEERRDATCSAEVKSSEGRGDAPRGLQAPYKRSATANHDGSESVSFPAKELGKPDAGKPPVRFDEGREADGHWPLGLSIRRFPPTLHKMKCFLVDHASPPPLQSALPVNISGVSLSCG